MPLPRRAAAAATLALVLAGCRIDVTAEAAPDGYHRMADGTLMADVAAAQTGGHDHHDVDPADFPKGSVPVSLEVPRLDLVAPVVATRMNAAAIEGPPVAGDVAWLEQTRRPGEIGPAILGGVTELDGTPGAFARLAVLEPGDEFQVVGADGDTLPYVVIGIARIPVAERERVFAMGEDRRSEIRLVAWAIDEADEAAADLVISAHARDAAT
jgi:hypothetical protein